MINADGEDGRSSMVDAELKTTSPAAAAKPAVNA
jgi:hypothetical protein